VSRFTVIDDLLKVDQEANGEQYTDVFAHFTYP